MRGLAHAVTIKTTPTMDALVNRNPDNSISLKDAIEHLASATQLPEHRIPAIEMRLRRVGHEELTAAGIGTRERHAEGASHVAMRVELVADGIPRSTISVAARIASLNHEIWNHPVEPLPVEVPTPGQRHEVVHGKGRLGGEECQLDGTALRFDSGDR